jgi:hypothetical protein
MKLLKMYGVVVILVKKSNYVKNLYLEYIMAKSNIIFNVFMYGIVIAYILYINIATYYNSGKKFLNFLIKLFNNWIFRLIFLLIVGFFSLDLFPYGGFIFAILLTIAFLNTNMLVYKKEISESFVCEREPSEKKLEDVKEKFREYSDKFVRNDNNDILEPLEDKGNKFSIQIIDDKQKRRIRKVAKKKV